MSKHLIWEEVAELYKERTGGRARIMPMQDVFDWALTQPDIKEVDGGYLILESEDN